MINPDFAKVADAMGITGENIHKVEDVGSSCKRAFDYNGPYLLNRLHQIQMHWQCSKSRCRVEIIGMAKSMTKTNAWGRVNEVLIL